MMSTLKTTLFACALSIAGLMTNNTSVNAQFAKLVDTGTVIPDIAFTDIKGNKFTLYEYLDQGYTVAIELALTTCHICWAYKNEGSFQRLYKNYGPTGTVKSKKILPIFIEFNPGTDRADLQGKGQTTKGDWTSGVNYPIIDLATAREIDAILDPFFDYSTGSTRSINTPTMLMICPDRKLILAEEGLNNAQESQMVALMEKKCPLSKVGISETLIMDESLHIYPNPVDGIMNISLETKEATKATFTISNILGQALTQRSVDLQNGVQQQSVHTDMLAPGMYMLAITTEGGTIQKKFIKK